MSITSKIIEINDIKTDLTDAINSKLPEPELYYTDGLKDFPDSIYNLTSGTPPADLPIKDVNFFDYDGTLVYSYTKAEFLQLSVLPSGPTHTGLTFQEWNWRLSEITTYVNKGYRVDVGANYNTSDNSHRIYVRKKADNLWQYIYWRNASSKANTINWGDGETTSLTAANGGRSAIHLYSQPGEYVISIADTGAVIYFGQSGSSPGVTYTTIAGAAQNYTDFRDDIYKIELGSNARIYSAAFYRSFNLETITIPSTMAIQSNAYYMFDQCPKLKCVCLPHSYTVLRSYFFGYCASIKYLPLPPGITTINTYALSYMYSLKYVLIPSGVTTFGASALAGTWNLEEIGLAGNITSLSSAFAEQRALKHLAIPSTCTEMTGGSAWRSLQELIIPEGALSAIPASRFNECYSIKKIDLPSTCTSVGSKAFEGCNACMTIICRATTPPTASADSFTGFLSSAAARPEPLKTGQKIYVPQGTSATYKAATGWSTYADYIYELDSNGNIPS